MVFALFCGNHIIIDKGVCVCITIGAYNYTYLGSIAYNHCVVGCGRQRKKLFPSDI